MDEEAKLLRRLKNGDGAALEAVIGRYTPYLSAVLWRAGGGGLSPEDQEELLSDVFLALWQNAARLDPDRGGVRAYLAATARHGVYRRLRARRQDLSLEAQAETGAEPAAEDPDRLGLWDAVAMLGEEDLELFVRYYRYGQSLREIAGAMGMKLSTVKTRLFRGKQKLKQILTEAEGIR